MATESIEGRAAKVLSEYLKASGQTIDTQIVPKTKLMSDLGLCTDDGVNIVLDFCTEFDLDLPPDFNALVSDNGKRERSFGELVRQLNDFIVSKERAK